VVGQIERLRLGWRPSLDGNTLCPEMKLACASLFDLCATSATWNCIHEEIERHVSDRLLSRAHDCLAQVPRETQPVLETDRDKAVRDAG
jgi:hypothetical protein